MSELYQTEQPAHVGWAEQSIARSATYRRLAQASTAITASGAHVVKRVDNQDADRARRGGVLELTLLPHTGFRGAGTADWLSSLGYPLPLKPNMAVASADGNWVLRLSQTEHWLLASPADLGQSIDELPTDMSQTPDGCYPLYCRDSHAWLMLTGEHTGDILAKLSAVDMRESVFPPGSIAQTSIARINAILVRQQFQGLAAVSILCDIASSDYLWTVLMDAVQEFGGGAVGLDVLTGAR